MLIQKKWTGSWGFNAKIGLRLTRWPITFIGYLLRQLPIKNESYMRMYGEYVRTDHTCSIYDSYVKHLWACMKIGRICSICESHLIYERKRIINGHIWNTYENWSYMLHIWITFHVWAYFDYVWHMKFQHVCSIYELYFIHGHILIIYGH